MKKSTILIIFLLLFFTVSPNVYAADPVSTVVPTPTSTNLTPEGEDASTISTFDGSYRLAIESVQAQVGSETNIHNIYLTVRQNMASFVNRIAFQVTGTLGMYPGKTKAEILEQNLAESDQKGIALMAYDSAYSLLQSSPSQNIAGYYAGMLLPDGFAGNQSSVYADDCMPYNPGATPTPLPSGDWGVLTQPPSCEGTTTYWNILSLSNLWSVSFTIAMSFVVMVLIYAGFMMMFRKKASGQGLVTISMALQNVVIGSVLALMSFALGAFFLNLSKFLTLIVADMFNQLMWSEFDPTVLTKWLGFEKETANTYISSPLSIFTKFVLVSLYGDYLAGSTHLGALQGLLPITSQALSGDLAGSGASAKMWFWDNLPTAQFWLKSPLYLIGRIIAAGVLFWYSIRIWWETVKTFLFMVGDTLLAPITFVMGSIPGMWQGQGVSLWFKRMLKNSLKAPAMFALVNVAGYVSISLALKSSTTDPLAMISGGYYGSSGGMMNVGGMVNDVMGFIASGVGPNFIAMLAILSFVPRVPAFLDEAMDVKGLSMSRTIGNTLQTFDKMVFNEARQFDARGKDARKAGDKVYNDSRAAGKNPVTSWVKATGTTLKGNNDAIGKTFRSNFASDPTDGKDKK
jgi:hypothetical protein